MVILKFLSLSVVAASLHSCPASLKPEKIPPKPSVTYVCTHLKKYPMAVREKAAAELEAYRDLVPTIAEWIADYGSVREGILLKCPGALMPG